VAERIGFVLIAGEQYEKSWNAGECCGQSRRKGVDDVGYIRILLGHVAERLAVANTDAVFAFGWSNGGFMATTIAHTTSLLAGVAVAAGYTYQHLRPLEPGSSTLNATLMRKTPILFFHAHDDTVVRAAGCCASLRGASKCCCGIGEQTERCISVMNVWKAWSLANGCGRSPVMRVSVDLPAPVPPMRCLARERCAAETIVCTSATGGHSLASMAQTGHEFAYARTVTEFFARQACALGGGAWDARGGGGACMCDGGASRGTPQISLVSLSPGAAQAMLAEGANPYCL